MGIQRKFNRKAKREQVRRLAFDSEESKGRWDILYGGMLVNPEGYGRETRRVARRVLEKLESIAEPVDNEGIAKFQLGDVANEPRELVFEEAEFKLLRSTVDGINWTRHAVILADKTIEWLDTIKEERKERNPLAAEPG